MTDHTGVNAAAANYNGPYPAALAGLPQSAVQDGLYVRDGARLTIELSNLKADHVYDFLIYGAASNLGDRSLYRVIGSTTTEVQIGPLINNATQVATFNGIGPDANREINIEFEGRLLNGSPHNPNVVADAMGRINFLQIVERLRPLPGDYNADNIVNSLDYNVWRTRLGTANAAADGNGNGVVDAADYVLWRKNFGRMRSASGGSLAENSSPVPEPVAGVLLLWGLAFSAGPARRNWPDVLPGLARKHAD
jgi:hypothetical protein